MQNTRLVELLRTFKEKELTGFEEFISSKFFNKNPQIIELFTHIKKYYPGFESDELLKQNLYAEIFGKKKYNDEVMRTLISGLMKLAKKYLIQIELEKRFYDGNLMLLTQLQKRAQQSLLEYEYNKAKTQLNEKLFHEREFYLSNYLGDFELFYSYPLGIKDTRKEIALLNGIASNFENFMLHELMDINYQMLTRKIKTNFPPEYLLIDEVKKMMETKDYSDNPSLLLKYYSFISIEDMSKEEYYEKCEKLFLECYDKISTFEHASIHLALVNYCMLKISQGVHLYYEKVFELYKFALERGLYFEHNKYMLPFLFLNIVKCGLYLEQRKWVLNFIFEYKNKITPEARKEISNVSFALYYFAEGEFENSLKHINKITTHFTTLKLEIKTLSIKLFYELGYIESIYSSVDALKHFVKNTPSLSKHFKAHAVNFNKYIIKLVELKEKRKISELDYLRKEISGISEFGLINQKWIIEKINRVLEK
jgi:hypothetical protein